MFNFEKYMMTKPDTPTITINDSDSSANDDTLFGVNTSTRLNEELAKRANDSIVSSPSNYSQNEDKKSVELDNLDNFDIMFENIEPTLEDSSKDGGAITETYETAAIKENKK